MMMYICRPASLGLYSLMYGSLIRPKKYGEEISICYIILYILLAIQHESFLSMTTVLQTLNQQSQHPRTQLPKQQQIKYSR